MERIEKICDSVKTTNPGSISCRGCRLGWAANYFPTLSRSIIVAAGLNFSVRNAQTHSRRPTVPLPVGSGTRAEAFGPLVPLGSTCRHAHTCGLSTWSSPTALQGGLISGRASRLDAFSAYPFRTRLPGRAPGGATGSPLVRPTRSSRTKVRSPQASNARNR